MQAAFHYKVSLPWHNAAHEEPHTLQYHQTQPCPACAPSPVLHAHPALSPHPALSCMHTQTTRFPLYLTLHTPHPLQTGQVIGKVTGSVKTQLIAHDKEVHDIAFTRAGTGRDLFASVGSDGSVRMFDLRCGCMLPQYARTCIFKICDQHQEPETVGLTPRCFMGLAGVCDAWW